MLAGFEGVVPQPDHVVHGRSRVREAFLRTVIMDRGVVVSKQGILDLNLGSKNVRKQGEDGGEDCRQTLA